MIRTILITPSISVQGYVKAELPDGRLTIDEGRNTFTGFPPSHPSASAQRQG